MDHLHQVFITKNPVLCSEVKKNFSKLSHSCAAAREHVAVENIDLPSRFQDVHPAAFPLFLTSREFLLMLDASLPPPYFFERNEDGTLKEEVAGWQEEDAPLRSIEEIWEYLEDEEEEDSLDAKGVKIQPDELNAKRREISYEFFEGLYQKIKHNLQAKVDYSPALVWTEITSFIEGSVEALDTERGFLSREEYESLGRNRAPIFKGSRDHIYELFLRYHQLKSKNLFSEGDLIFNLHQRMAKYQGTEWVIHYFFVDETQDFTQAELWLLIQCCQDPNNMLLAGDTAQAIMRGISFRFEDLKPLFHYAQKRGQTVQKKFRVEVPKEPCTLKTSYRSHAGILCLASSIVDLMAKFFPKSFDHLDGDQGLYPGPKPIILETCSFNDLTLLMKGKQKASHIEFGAHQAILVKNDKARDGLPKELMSTGLVVTIFESKGLEFDDVLLYNFFKDSPVMQCLPFMS